MRVTLLISKFKYIRLGTDKVHVCEAGLTDLAYQTFCGRSIADGIQAMSEHSMQEMQLCGRCYASLRTYIHGQVKIEKEQSNG